MEARKPRFPSKSSCRGRSGGGRLGPGGSRSLGRGSIARLSGTVASTISSAVASAIGGLSRGGGEDWGAVDDRDILALNESLLVQDTHEAVRHLVPRAQIEQAETWAQNWNATPTTPGKGAASAAGAS